MLLLLEHNARDGSIGKISPCQAQSAAACQTFADSQGAHMATHVTMID